MCKVAQLELLCLGALLVQFFGRLGCFNYGSMLNLTVFICAFILIRSTNYLGIMTSQLCLIVVPRR